MIEAGGTVNGFVAITRDVTEARAAAERRAQAERLEAIGQLAGGVAHDFNNMLIAIKGYVGFVLENLRPGTADHSDLLQALGAADRAATLTRRLLAFSRRQRTEPRVVDPVEIVSALLPMLRRLIGEHITVDAVMSNGVPPVLLDPGLLDQVVLNLAVNARDAMPNGGQIGIRVEPVVLDGHEMARLTLSDTGVGMSAEMLARIFEPFFTTKDVGRGTGLGLATVRAAVDEFGGTLAVSSTVGVGTTFTIDIPRAPEEVVAEDMPGPVAHGVGPKRILVVEDQPEVREVARRHLQALGHAVVETATPAEATRLVASGELVDLLLTDVRLPGMQGPELVKVIRERIPDLPVLFMSGLIDELGSLDELEAEVLPKPFDREGLAAAVQRALV